MNKYLAFEGTSDWFESLYAEAVGNSTRIPWAWMKVTPCLHDWLRAVKWAHGRHGWFGLGDDAEVLGFMVVSQRALTKRAR